MREICLPALLALFAFSESCKVPLRSVVRWPDLRSSAFFQTNFDDNFHAF